MKKIFIILVLLFSIFYVSKSNYDFIDGISNKLINVDYTISNDLVGLIDFGYTNILADYYYLSAVQYMGEQALKDGDYESLPGYLHNIVALDPHFIFTYKIATLILADYNIDEAISINKYGAYHNPDQWSPLYNLGYLYGIVLNRPFLGAGYFDLAATKSGVLESAKYLGAALRRQHGRYDAALAYWVDIARNPINSDEYEKAKLEISRIDNMKQLYIAALVYIKKYNKEPDFYMHDLVDANLIKYIPKDPSPDVGYGWYTDEKIVKITVAEDA